jgi:hypothetical protein
MVVLDKNCRNTACLEFTGMVGFEEETALVAVNLWFNHNDIR